jgi:preprotein translocase subunit YajC
MFEKYEGKEVRVVFNLDGGGDARYRRGHRGTITEVDRDFVEFVTNRGSRLTLRNNVIISIEELVTADAR